MAGSDGSLRSLSPVLIANRGEIAIRVAEGAARLGLETVAVFTDADAEARHVSVADRAVRVSSYLDGDALVGACKRSGARAVHPGYGFLSENAGFARAVTGAGLIWIGPPPAAIELMGDKARSKQLAAEAGVPTIPGTEGEDAGLDLARRFAESEGYPVLIKAVSGGGGKGMRVVAAESELESAYAAARREGESAFGDPRVLVERYLERPRHIEIQVLADSHGNVTHLGERECSLQRRHQKVIEEAPSPAIDPGMRDRMGAAAVELARACDYEGAGTVEFIATTEAEEFFFLEMNTRLQVEHPVTELVWGVDLVEQQLRVAAGEELGFSHEDLTPRGHAVEARLYAEDPASGFLPSTGRVARWAEPAGEGIRIDAGIAEGGIVGTEFDPMLAKVIAHGPDREVAVGRLDRALAELAVLGVKTNAAFSRQLLADPDVVAGRLDTGLLERRLDELDLEPPADLALAAAVAWHHRDTCGHGEAAGGWVRRFSDHGEVRIDGSTISLGDQDWQLGVAAFDERLLRLELDGELRVYAIAIDGETVYAGRGGHQVALTPELADRTGAAALSGSLEAPMPGKVLSIEVGEGDEVEEGAVLMVLESMKMELQINAPTAGRVEGLELSVGDQVAVGEALVAVVPPGEQSDE